jgi:hypothetical protein
MRTSLDLHCRCGEVHAKVSGVSPQTVNRIVCYCDDCQAFLHHLHRTDLLDEHGGTDIVQVAPASLAFDRGTGHIVGVRLSPKGLYRWYASCCKTPVGNTVGPALPLVGIVAQAFPAEERDEILGKPIGGWLGKYALGNPPIGSTKFNPRLMIRLIRMILGWRIRGRTWPHPFFVRETRTPRYPVSILSRDQREALRSLRG